MGRNAARELLSGPRPPTAFVAIIDMCATGICRGAKDPGSVRAGRLGGRFGDILLADRFEPPLTTVHRPLTGDGR
ncbi:hypothetical protein [Streptomyces sp. NPDC060035]|uniref:hypothetical protein n=1 Tax=Streptomyces sp. NPDC060035 TaxID=3347044 RepID=UPI0036A3513F